MEQETQLTVAADVAKPHIPELDGVRGLAILLVLIWHYVVYPRYDWLYYYAPNTAVAFGLTWSGVDLFFVLSGFLLGGILLDNARAPHYFKAFYVRRACRILPLYFAWLLLFYLLFWFLPGLSSSSSFEWLFARPLPWWSYVSLTQNFIIAKTGDYGANWLGVTWSLAVEEQFYLVLPLLLRFVPRRRLPWLLAGLIITAPLVRWWLFKYHARPVAATYTLTLCRMDELLAGVLCAYLLRLNTVREFLLGRVKLLYGLLAIVVALLGIGILIHRSPTLGFAGLAFGSFGMTVYGYTLLTLLYSGLLLLAVTERRGLVTWICRQSWLRRLGTIAYAVYLFHQVFNGLGHALLRQQGPRLYDWTDALISCAALICMLFAATLSWRWFEKPLIMLGHSVKYSASQPAIKV
jgi:peptidoglycan/LPS O-acetylase OafA/YrhL